MASVVHPLVPIASGASLKDNMKAIAILSKSAEDSGAGKFFAHQCFKAGVNLEFTDSLSGQDYIKTFKSHDNIITWNCRMSQDWMTKDRKNILFVENSLISQRSGMFIDSQGFYTNSSLNKERHWGKKEKFDLKSFALKNFGWNFHQGGDTEGPILIALQCKQDANLRYNYPLNLSKENPNETTLFLAKQYLPSHISVIVRPHPREPELDIPNFNLPPNWRVESKGKFSDILTKVRALVTVNSTCASEATLLGVPVATLGVGAFSGADISLECAHNPERLAELLMYQPNLDAHSQYAAAVLSHHFIPYNSELERYVPEFERWLLKIIQ